MGTPTRDDVWLCLHLYEQRREPVLRAAREWLFGFAPRSFKDVKAVMDGKAGPDAARYFRQVMSYWDMNAVLLASGGLTPECVELFIKTTREFFLAYSKVAPFLEQIRAATRPTAFQNLERFCKSLPDHDAWLEYFTKMNEATRARGKARKRSSAKRRR